MRKIVLLIIMTGFITGCKCFAADGEFAVSKIPALLLKNTHVVKRMEDESFTIKNAGEAYYKIKYALTILDENGDDEAKLEVGYYKFKEVRSISGNLYNGEGKLIKNLKNRDIQDVSGVSGNDLINDVRIKSHNFYCKNYPYTVEYEYEVVYNGTMFFPYWMPQEKEEYSVEQSRFTITCPENYQFRYKAFNYGKEPVVATNKGGKAYVWEVNNIPALVSEPLSPEFPFLTTYIVFAPTVFEMQGYKGNMENWSDFGKFVYALKQGRDELPDNIKKMVHQLTDNETDVKEKIRKLYEYMQKNTRYVSIQLGIGSWQPFDAKYVAEKGYGDCKALTNYMYSLLKEAGVRSYYTIIRAGDVRKNILVDFPYSSFNHVILCTPVGKDTVWLECTSQTLPAGYLSDFTSDRYALLVDETGGKLVHTPKYGLKDNLQLRSIKAKLDLDGNLHLSSNAEYTAWKQDDLYEIINYLSKDKVKEYLHKRFNFATYDISTFDYNEQKSTLPSVQEKLEMVISNYATISGKRIFITPDIMTRKEQRLKSGEDRKYDLVLDKEFCEKDSVEIEVPSGYVVEAMPEPVVLNSKFGVYKSSTLLNGNHLFFYRERQQYSGRFDAKEYEDLVNFYNKMYDADRARLVLVKKE